MPIEDLGPVLNSPVMSANSSQVHLAEHTVNATQIARDSAAALVPKKQETMIQALRQRETQGTRKLRPLKNLENSALGARTTRTMSHDQGWCFSQGIEYNRLSKALKHALPGERPGLDEYALRREIENLRMRQNDSLSGYTNLSKGNSYIWYAYALLLDKLPEDETLHTELYRQLFSTAKEIENSDTRAAALESLASIRPMNQTYADAQGAELLTEAEKLPDTSAAERILRTLTYNG